MAYFPFFVDLQDKKCFIMGGGEVAYRKAAALLPFGVYIYIKALTYCEKLTSLKNTTKGQIQLTLGLPSLQGRKEYTGRNDDAGRSETECI